ncbi:MAG: hypothetical protein OXR72_00160 [Gemmatimonadota bacterium]|nr:hypothetical protein [Gemmatimonadota bacterium]
MKCDLPREELIGFLYDDVDADRKAGIVSHLNACPSCTQALEELKTTGNLLRAWADEDPPASLVFVPDRRTWWKSIIPDWLSTGNRRWLAPGLSMGLAAVILILAAFNLEARFDGQGGVLVKLRLPMGVEPERTEAANDVPLTRAELIQVQQQSLALIQDWFDEGQQRQRAELSLILDDFARDLETQRRRDLLLVGQGLREIDGATESRFMQTEDLLHHLLAVSYAHANPNTPLPVE